MNIYIFIKTDEVQYIFRINLRNHLNFVKKYALFR